MRLQIRGSTSLHFGFPYVFGLSQKSSKFPAVYIAQGANYNSVATTPQLK